jgi:hypothetical protein
MKSEQPKVQWDQIVAMAWTDEAFRKRLLADPATVLKEQGLEVPAGVQFKVVEDTEVLRHLTLPLKPSDELAEEELARGVGGVAAGCGGQGGACGGVTRVSGS